MILLCLLLAQEDALQAVRKSLEKTAETSYYYTVEGRFTRSGEYEPPGILTARIGSLESVRNDNQTMLKGPDGRWKTPAERNGEQADKLDAELVDQIRTLDDASIPHVAARELLDLVDRATKGDDTTIDKTPVHVYTLRFSKERLKVYLDGLITNAVARGSMKKPDAIKWSTLEGSMKVYIDKKDGWLARLEDERSVKIEYKDSGAGKGEKQVWKSVMDFAGWGRVKATVPDEVRERVGLPKNK